MTLHSSFFEQFTSLEHIIMAMNIAICVRNHPQWPLSCVSAAMLYGAYPSIELHEYVHVATQTRAEGDVLGPPPDEILKVREASEQRVCFHHIEDSCPTELIDHVLEACTTRDWLSCLYVKINDVIGLQHGAITTSLPRTMFDCMRVLPFEHGLALCDQLLGLSDLTLGQILDEARAWTDCEHGQLAFDRLLFTDLRTGSYLDSRIRAHIITAGFEVPTLDPTVRDHDEFGRLLERATLSERLFMRKIHKAKLTDKDFIPTPNSEGNFIAKLERVKVPRVSDDERLHRMMLG
ncbi:hypothetical protein [Alloscardovia macacae]|uniref:Uncharacterized protein n=1 Tax=Alloscardovia macacae TaxID=1160091 RepID=A0A261F3Z2_9BIFI|nr:hypothetical protein [Alloscardovia macacae]OZG53840.1 hypothetical protein ALMA_1082 [Alloscardovia macacae]